MSSILTRYGVAVAPRTATAQLLRGWLNAWSYNLGDSINLLRDKMVQLHNICDKALADYTGQLQEELKLLRRKLPRPTRENPYPDMTEPLDAVKQLDAYIKEIEAIRVCIRSLSVPPNEMVYRSLKENQKLFESLVSLDSQLLHTLAEVTDESISNIRRILDEREQLLRPI